MPSAPSPPTRILVSPSARAAPSASCASPLPHHLASPDLTPPPLPVCSLQIVGGGEFGTATALSLVKGAYAQHGSLITILDRSATPPSNDAASSDLNKVGRAPSSKVTQD